MHSHVQLSIAITYYPRCFKYLIVPYRKDKIECMTIIIIITATGIFWAWNTICIKLNH